MQQRNREGFGEDLRVVAWDLPTRLFHWTLLALVLSAWVSFRFSENFSDHLLKWHRWNGLAVLTLLVWRVMWGLWGPPTARFSSFVRGPGTALGYARDLAAGRPRHFLGHNPLGAFMVLALLAALFAQASLGLFTVEHNDLTAGPLYRLVDEASRKWASRWHHNVFDMVLIPLIVLHVLANLLYGVVKREPLIPAMITGRKPAGAYEDAPAATSADGTGRTLLRAAVLLAIAAAIVLGGIRIIAGRLI